MIRQEQKYNPLDFEPDVAIGIGLPMTPATAGKYPTPLLTYQGSSSMENSDQEIGSEKFTGGVFNSTYTTNEQGLLFENITPAVVSRVHEAIFQQISAWLPYVTIKAVDVNTDRIDNNELRIKLDYIIFGNEVDLQTVVIFA